MVGTSRWAGNGREGRVCNRGADVRAGKRRRRIKVRGIVIPHDWDESGKVLAVVLSAPEEVEYRVAEEAKGRELMRFVHQQVDVTGWVNDDGKGGLVLTVERISIERSA
jgi:hypothetical protein